MPPIDIYLKADDWHSVADDGGNLLIEHHRPFYDVECTREVMENDAAPTAERVFYCRLAGGTHHLADLQHSVFNFGSQVLIYPERSNPADPNALLVVGQEGKTAYRAGYLPKELAASLAPLIPKGEGGMGLVIGTVVKDGTRVGLRIIGTVGRTMTVATVEETQDPE